MCGKIDLELRINRNSKRRKEKISMNGNELATKIEDQKKKIREVDAKIDDNLAKYDRATRLERERIDKYLEVLGEERYILNKKLNALRDKAKKAVAGSVEDFNTKMAAVTVKVSDNKGYLMDGNIITGVSV